MCYYANCEETGTWRPVLVLKKDEDDPGTKVRFKNPGRVSACGAHRSTLGPRDFLSAEAHDVLARHLRERAQEVPERKLTTLLWEEIT